MSQEGKVILDRISQGDNSRTVGRQIRYVDTRDNVIEALILPPPVNMGSPLVSASVFKLDGSIDIHLENNFFKLVGKFTPNQLSIYY